MARHTFDFEGGEELTTMGANRLVSYSYFYHLDKNHRNWDKISTVQSRSSVYNRTKNMHNYWLKQVLDMKNSNLEKTLSASVPQQSKKWRGNCSRL